MTQQSDSLTAGALLHMAMHAAEVHAFVWDLGDCHEPFLHGVAETRRSTKGAGVTLESVAQSVHPSDRATFRASVLAALRSADGHYRSQHRLQRADGEVRWISQFGRVEFDEAQRAVRLSGISHDITDHRHTQEQSSARDTRYQHLLANIEQGFCVVEMVYDTAGRAVDYRFLETNAAFERHTGLVGANGRTARALVPNLEQKWVAIYAGVAETGNVERFEQTSQAMARMFGVEAVRVGDPAKRQVALLFSDITERERWSRALSESEARFRQMADGLPLIVWVHDAEGALEFVNATFCEFFGVSREELRAVCWQALTHPDDSAAFTDELVASSRERRPFHVEVRARSANGQWRWLECWARPWFGQDGAFRGHIGTSADVTDRKAVEQALRDADRSKDEFLATLAHELRNPLAPIHNVAQLIESNPSPDVVGRAVGILRRQVGQMARLLDDLLDVSRLTLKRLRLQSEVVDLRDVIADALEQASAQLDDTQQSVVLDMPTEPVRVKGDRMRLAQVVSNLLNNAARYSAGPGRVRVRVGRCGAMAEVAVRDQGIGIRNQDLGSVFGMLVQGNAEQRSARGGLGIGLQLVKSLVDLHGGSVQVHSDGEGRGAEFTVRLPALADTGPSADPGTAPQLPSTQGNHRVLVVDDNIDSAESMAMLLANHGYDTRTAYNGANALRTAEEFRPVAVLLDIGLPDISGMEVAQQIRRAEWGRAMRLAALSGWGKEADIQRALEAGFDQHLTKPADLTQLQHLLESLLGDCGGASLVDG